MKRVFLMMSLVFGLALAGCVSIGVAAGTGPMPQVFGAELDIGYCYDYLAPYGTWIDLDPYGYVWCPRHMGYGWRPYSEGHWFWTDDGWCWDSDLDWGWMPFHYGRWGFDEDCGWFWVPGTVWGPAWVFWRFGDLYCGWAPIPPGFDFRPGIDFDAFAVGLPLNFWCFIDGRHFLDPDIHGFVLPYERNPTVVRLTEFRNLYQFRGGRVINEGIDPEAVRRITGRPVTRYAIASADRPGGPRVSGNEIRIYRPAIRETAGARPKQFVSRDQVRREMGPARIYEAPPRVPNAAPEAAVRQGQAQERKRLDETQALERRNLEQSRAAAAQKVASQAERAKIEQDYKARMTEQQKQHQAERQKMNERHRAEAEQVKRSAPPKQPEPKQGPRRK